MVNAIVTAKSRETSEQEEPIMKKALSRQGAYAGAGAGAILFGLFGLLPGSLLGGAMGIGLAGMIFTLPLEPGLLSRMIVFGSMLVGLVVSGTMIVTATSAIGWLAGHAMETTMHGTHSAIAAAERR